MRFVLGLLFLLLLVAGGAYWYAGRLPGPTIQIAQPTKVVGQSTPLEVTINAPRGTLTALDVAIEQNGERYPLFGLPGTEGATMNQEGEDTVRVRRQVGRRTVKQLRGGPARIVASAERPVLFGLRHARSEVARDVAVRLDPPRLSVVSMHHFVNHGGSEMIVYRVTPPDVESGVRVGDITYPGYPAAGAGVAGADASMKVAFFGLLWDQDLNTPIAAYARDEAGNEARASFGYRAFPRPVRRSRIEITDAFLQRVVPEILQHTPDLAVENPDQLVDAFLAVNGTLRRQNAEAILELARKTEPRILWEGTFQQLTNSSVESNFADQRTYFYQGKEIDRQVHLGFDLAVTANVPIHASNRGTVVFADYLGIYGNAVVVDHGMGLQTIYAHLSSIDVEPGGNVERGTVLGRSGMTGLAGGDHLHFTTLLQGRPVNPVDWWSAQWIEDRILRKLREAGVTPGAATAP